MSEMVSTGKSLDFHRLEHLPPYVFAEVNELMLAARRTGREATMFVWGGRPGLVLLVQANTYIRRT
jgi:hypothetical protein